MDEHELKSYDEFINEVTRDVVYPTNFKGMVQVALSGVYTQIMAIAQEIANEKAARDPRNSGDIEEIDITRAMSMVFHSNWKKKLKDKALGSMMLGSMDRAKDRDIVVSKKNQKALRQMDGSRDDEKIDTSITRTSDRRDGSGPGSNQ